MSDTISVEKYTAVLKQLDNLHTLLNYYKQDAFEEQHDGSHCCLAYNGFFEDVDVALQCAETLLQDPEARLLISEIVTLTPDEQFIKHCEDTTEYLKTWPEWKRNMIGHQLGVSPVCTE